ncbi:MAG: hypothetical protein ACYC61_04295 [Isosphaeraceae bacterium]
MIAGDRRFRRLDAQPLLADDGEVAVELQQIGARRDDVEEHRPARAANVQVVEPVDGDQQALVIDLVEDHGRGSRRAIPDPESPAKQIIRLFIF